MKNTILLLFILVAAFTMSCNKWDVQPIDKQYGPTFSAPAHYSINGQLALFDANGVLQINDGCIITLTSSNFKTITLMNKEENFNFQDLKPAKYILKIHKDGYDDSWVQFSLYKNSDSVVLLSSNNYKSFATSENGKLDLYPMQLTKAPVGVNVQLSDLTETGTYPEINIVSELKSSAKVQAFIVCVSDESNVSKDNYKYSEFHSILSRDSTDIAIYISSNFGKKYGINTGIGNKIYMVAYPIATYVSQLTDTLTGRMFYSGIASNHSAVKEITLK